MDIDFLIALSEVTTSNESICILSKDNDLLICTNLLATYKNIRDVPENKFATGWQNSSGQDGVWSVWGNIEKRSRRESINEGVDFSFSDFPNDHFSKRFTTSIEEETFIRTVEKMKQDMRQGEYFLANLTRIIELKQEIDPIYLAILSCFQHETPFRFYSQTETQSLLGLSPERFMRIENGVATCEPMKGTAKDESQLVGNKKEHDENTMMIDLVRSDLSQICVAETIKVNSRNNISTHPGLVQMSSNISGELRSDVLITEAIFKMMPIASVTGTPKPHVVKVIEDLEPQKRETYCGTYGWVDTQNNRCDLAVAIRTITADKDRVQFGVGAGITIESDPLSEWNETQLKASRLQHLIEESIPIKDDGVFTSLLVNSMGKSFSLEKHCKRLALHASRIDVNISQNEIELFARKFISETEIKSDSVMRISIGKSSPIKCTIESFDTKDLDIVLGISPIVFVDDFDSPKYLNRHFYEKSLVIAQSLSSYEIDDAILISRGKVIETTRANLFFEIDGKFITPKISRGMIQGVARQCLVEAFKERGLELIQKDVTLDELSQANEIITTNSVRGPLPVALITGALVTRDLKVPKIRGNLFDFANEVFEKSFS